MRIADVSETWSPGINGVAPARQTLRRLSLNRPGPRVGVVGPSPQRDPIERTSPQALSASKVPSAAQAGAITGTGTLMLASL